jgi:hypothetical protein
MQNESNDSTAVSYLIADNLATDSPPRCHLPRSAACAEQVWRPPSSAKKAYTARRVLPNGAFRRFSVNSANSAKFGKTKWGGGGERVFFFLGGLPWFGALPLFAVFWPKFVLPKCAAAV